MKRYRAEVKLQTGSITPEIWMIEDPNGEFVTYREHIIDKEIDSFERAVSDNERKSKGE
jgi:hypothetical protein